MKKLIFLSFFLVFVFFPIYRILAEEISISEVNVSDLIDGRAIVRWNTNVSTKGEIYYGKSQDSMSSFMGYSQYDINHESTLTGLEEDEIYYFKIISIDIFGNRAESFVQTFDTNDMVNTTPPEITVKDMIQTTWDSVMISWKTNKTTKADIFYGMNEDDLNKKTSYSSYAIDHVKIISKLTPNTRYYIKIIAKDKNGNTTNTMLNCNTTLIPSVENKVLQLKNIEPINYDSSLIGARNVKIKF